MYCTELQGLGTVKATTDCYKSDSKLLLQLKRDLSLPQLSCMHTFTNTTLPIYKLRSHAHLQNYSPVIYDATSSMLKGLMICNDILKILYTSNLFILNICEITFENNIQMEFIFTNRI